MLTRVWARKGTVARATSTLVACGNGAATGGGGRQRRRFLSTSCDASSSVPSAEDAATTSDRSGDRLPESGSATPDASASMAAMPRIHSPTTHGIDPGVVHKALDAVLSDEDAAYLIPLYIGDDGGHDHRVSQWFKSEGDAVIADEAVCEIETTEFLYDFGPQEDGFLALCAVEAEARVEDKDLVALLAPTEEELVDFRSRFEKACGGILTLQAEAAAAAQTTKLSETCPELEALLASTKMERYLDTFVEEGFDTRAALNTVTDEDLTELGVKAGHRRVLLEALKNMPSDEAEDAEESEGAAEQEAKVKATEPRATTPSKKDDKKKRQKRRKK